MKKSMLAAALVVLALAALPAVAAASPALDYEYGEFTVAGGEVQLTGAEPGIRCEGIVGGGEFETSQTGSVQFFFHECEEEAFGSACSSAGQPEGTIVTTTLPFHLKTTTEDHTPAMLVTPNSNIEEEHFATFECLGGFIEIVVEGNGVIGEIVEPGYGEASNTFTAEFKSTQPGSVIQTPRKVDETPSITYGLSESVNGGKPETAALDSEFTGTFAGGEKPTLTTLPE